MLHIKSLDEGLELFKALGSEIRIEIIKILLENPEMNMNELAARLQITNGALTSHVKKLEECGIIQVTMESAGHGNQKKCSVVPDKLLIDLKEPRKKENVYSTSLKIGHFSDCEVYPTCGMATASELVGQVDDPRYFAHPSRFDADILWLGRGYVEYAVPNFVPAGQQIDWISVSAELGSEAPGVNDTWPSDISFYINGKLLGKWTSPGDFGEVRGILTPAWWFPELNQYGLLKHLIINHDGTFIDSTQISTVTIDDLQLDNRSNIRLRLAVDEDSRNVGGLTIYGKTFGNYNQDIEVKLGYSTSV